jgi:hypothetical protein
MLRCTLLALPLTLAACGPGGNTNISIHDSDGDVNISTDDNGQASIKLPGFDATVKLPKMDITGDNFDVNGVKLYPGSTVRDVNIDAHDGNGDKDGRVALKFEAPASLDKVQAWFRDAMAKHGFKVSPQGSGFAGTTDDGQPITLELEADGPDKAKGNLTVGA